MKRLISRFALPLEEKFIAATLLLVGAIMQRDYAALQSVMVIYTLFIVVINIITDFIYSLVDPRITHF